MSIPARMILSAKMEAAQSLLSKALLTTLDFNNDDGTVTPSSSSPHPQHLSQIIPEQHTGSLGSICFVVRRPGWVLCREHGRQLTDLAKSINDGDTNADLMKGFDMFGVVKEIGVDDEGLTTFYKDHFTYPLYKDDGLVFYNDFFGKRSIFRFTTCNPFKLYSGYKKMSKRLSEKKLEGNMVGEGIVQGGIIIFDKHGKARYAYEEKTGKELDMEDIVASLKALQSDE